MKVNITKYSRQEMVQNFISNNFSHDIKKYISRMTKRGIQLKSFIINSVYTDI